MPCHAPGGSSSQVRVVQDTLSEMALSPSLRGSVTVDTSVIMFMRTLVMLMVALASISKCKANVGFSDSSVPIGLIVQDDLQQQYFLDASEAKIIPSKRASQFNISGHTFYSRILGGNHIVLVTSGKGLINGALITEVLLTTFRGVRWLIHYGEVASPNVGLNIGDFVIANKVAHTGNWIWQNLNDSRSPGVHSLSLVDYTTASRNSSGCIIVRNDLNKIWYRTSQVSSANGSTEFVFWLPTPSDAFTIPKREQLQCVHLGPSQVCLDRRPSIVREVRACSADIYVDNAAYAQFLTHTLHCDTVDMEAAAVAQAAKGHKHVTLLLTGTVANRAGLETDKKNPCNEVVDHIGYLNAVANIGAIVTKIPALPRLLRMPRGQTA